MKRIKLLLAIFTFAAMSAVGYTTYDMTMSTTDQLLLANVEALTADNELIFDYIYCEGYGAALCPIDYSSSSYVYRCTVTICW